MANYFSDNPDLQYYFERGVDWQRLAELVEQGFRLPDGHASAAEALEFYREVASVVGEVAANVVEPRAAAIDAEGMRLVDGEVVAPAALDEIFSQLGELGLHGLVIPRELGGQNAPALLYFMNNELLSRADTSVMTHHGFHGGIAMILYLLSLAEGTTRFDLETGLVTETRFAEEMAEVVRGEAWGCMDITEPDAGSDMAALSAYAEQDADGRWYITGQKIFITSGHGKYHFVIARTDRDLASGLQGLGMFLVKAYEEDASGARQRAVTIDRLEEKLGHHGSATASLSFERAPAALIGAPGEGFRYMLVLMNNARVSVGFESLGLMESAYRRAAEYAAGRVSMGKTIDRHEMIADALDEMRTEIQGIRALAVAAGYHEELAMRLGRVAQLTTKDEVERQRLRREAKEHQALARRLTPLVKYIASEKAVEHARRAMQIHGGNGYIVEYGVERLLRDALVLPIYEGTSQIQALMAMRDTLTAVIKSPQEFVRRLAEARWRALSARDPLARRVARVSLLCRGAEQHLVARTAGAKFRELVSRPVSEWSAALSSGWDPKRDFRFAMLHAERLCQLLADEAILTLLLDQAARHPERAEVLERYLERAEPRARHLNEVITSTGSRLIEQLSGGAEQGAPSAQAKAG